MSDSVCELTLVGNDGSEWDVMRGTQGLILGRGLNGVLFPQFEQNTTELIQGRRRNRTRYKAAEIESTFQVGDTAGSEILEINGGQVRRGSKWLSLDTQVRRALIPDGQVEFRAKSPDTIQRVLTCSVDEVDGEIELMPDIRGFQEYGVDLSSDGPFWRSSRPSTFDYSTDTTETIDYYGGTDGNGKGTPLYISGSGESIENALRNGGDVASWPTWTITGPTVAEMRVQNSVIETQLLAPGETLVIDTAPWSRSVTVDGQPAWNRLVRRQFAPIPTGSNPDVSIVIRDAGVGSAIRVEVFECFLGAW